MQTPGLQSKAAGCAASKAKSDKTAAKKPRLTAAARAELRNARRRAYTCHIIQIAVVTYISCASLILSVAFGVRRALREHYGIYDDFEEFSPMSFDQWILELIPDKAGYFIDIGAFSENGFSNTRPLEERGWNGICADPIPRGFESRSCGYVPRPIGNSSGNLITPTAKAAACGEAGYNVSGGFNEECAISRITTLGISELLSKVDAPPTMDFVSISARAAGVPILDGFPWERFCVRYWTFELDFEDSEREAEEINVRLAPHMCRTQSEGTYLWAACFCRSAAGSLAAAAGGEAADAAAHDDDEAAGDASGERPAAGKSREGHRAAFQRSSSLSPGGSGGQAAAEAQSSSDAGSGGGGGAGSGGAGANQEEDLQA